jgi:hypothetical protein
VDDGGGGGLPKHGTYVAGVIASQADDAGSVGIWPRAKIVSVRVFPDSASGTSTNAYITALNRCVDAGAAVVNLSLAGIDTAGATELAQLANKITSLRLRAGMDVVAAAGNTGGPVGYPAKFGDVVAVGASTAQGELCAFSSRGLGLDISTFGCGVELTYGANRVAKADGTSLAAPVVSGVLAALRYYNPDLTPEAAESLLTTSSRQSAAGARLDTAAAFRAAGLARLVDAPPPASSRDIAPMPRQLPSVEAPARTVEMSSDEPSGGTPLRDLILRRPRLRLRSYSKGILRIDVAGVPDFGRAIFGVGKRRYVRENGHLRVRSRQPPRIVTVVVDVPTVGRSAPLKVNVPRASGSAGKP